MGRPAKHNLPPPPVPEPPKNEHPVCDGVGIDTVSKTLHLHCGGKTVIFQLTADALAHLRQNFGG